MTLTLATSTIPIVAMASDPVQLGLVTSMARPGRNITGVSIDTGLELWEKLSDNIEIGNFGCTKKHGSSRNAEDR
jgi:ABC-type uncharacterized transport system substrate-binding protein